eukprot:2880375-Alexandrium_andersonii.AAC.1
MCIRDRSPPARLQSTCRRAASPRSGASRSSSRACARRPMADGCGVCRSAAPAAALLSASALPP